MLRICGADIIGKREYSRERRELGEVRLLGRQVGCTLEGVCLIV